MVGGEIEYAAPGTLAAVLAQAAAQEALGALGVAPPLQLGQPAEGDEAAAADRRRVAARRLRQNAASVDAVVRVAESQFLVISEDCSLERGTLYAAISRRQCASKSAVSIRVPGFGTTAAWTRSTAR